MNIRRNHRVIASVVLLMAAYCAQAAKPVMVHYMPWFQSELYPASQTWGVHWQKANFNPDTFNTNGQRNIASWYYPLVGPYDSLDPQVLEYHVLLMKLAGIDGPIVDWYGQESFDDFGLINDRTTALFNWTRKAGLKFAICFESFTVQAKVNGGFIAASNATLNAQQTMLYLQTNYFADPSYLRLTNKPVLLAFGNPPAYFTTSSQWSTIFSVLNATNQPAFFTEDNRLSPAGQGAYSWPPVYGGNTVSAGTWQNYLTSFDSKAAGYPEYIDGAFPRYHDIYGQAGATSNGYLDDANGTTFTNTLNRAMSGKANLVQIATWNDFGEGTIIEPTTQYGFRDLGVIQDLRRKYLDSTFPYHTNDVAQAFRFYNLRTTYNNYPALAAELNRVFTNICSGKLATAKMQMSAIEAGTPILYNFTHTGSQISFDAGGYVAGGAQVEVATDLAHPDWQTVQVFSGLESSLTFSTNVTSAGRSFFRIQ